MNTNPHLKRFLDAQGSDYKTALAEIKSGLRRSHWMWYIFPQIAGLGSTATSRYYAIKDISEATDFLFDETLGPRLVNGRYHRRGRKNIQKRQCTALFICFQHY